MNDAPIYLNAFALIIMFIITIIFFSKERVHKIEDNLYAGILVFSLLATLFGVILGFSLDKVFTYKLFFVGLFNKIYLICLIICFGLFIYYTFCVSTKLKINYKKYSKYWLIFCVILSIIQLILPIDVTEINGIASTGGIALYYYYVLNIVMYLTLIILVLVNFNRETLKKYIPIILLIIEEVAVLIIQFFYPAINYIVNPSITIACLVMYFTIENPDMKMIEQLNIAKDQAVKANDAKTDFLSSMSHEIRTPLNAIVGFSESLKEEQLSSEAKEEVNDIIDASNTLLEIVNGILDISKIEANKIEIVNSDYSFKKIFNELVALSKARLGESKPIEFRYKMDESIPDTLYGDYARIKQIILNLLTNSIKYTNEGYIDFQVNSIINENVCRLIVSVEDSGIGIKKESINKLFTKFERLDEKNTTIEGTGLGLAITKKLVEMMNGKIVVQSMYGKGSKFTVIIDQRIMANQVSDVSNTDDNVIKEYPNKKILIVDDNQLNLKVAARLLRCYKCQVEEVDSGFKAIDLIASNNHYDLILMDDMMPKLSGIDTFHRLKENPLFNTPVVALTANAISGMREKYLSEGFDEYLAKPIEKNELNAIINKFLS